MVNLKTIDDIVPHLKAVRRGTRKRYLNSQTSTLHAAQYKEEVEQHLFPTEENVRHLAIEELQQVIEWTQSNFLELSQR